MKSLPFLSNASPTGRKQFLGHFVLSWFSTMYVTASFLDTSAVGWPPLNSILPRRYPSGGLRFL